MKVDIDRNTARWLYDTMKRIQNVVEYGPNQVNYFKSDLQHAYSVETYLKIADRKFMKQAKKIKKEKAIEEE